jgi:transposase
VSDVEIMARVERRRKWTAEEKAALLAEVEAEGGSVATVARRHGMAESVLYDWRAAWKAATSMLGASPAGFIPLGRVAGVVPREPGMRTRASEAATGGIEIALPNGTRISVDAFVDEHALSRVLRAMKGAL